MNSELNKSKLEKIVKCLNKNKKKFYPVSALSYDTGIREDILRNFLMEFNPLVSFDDEFDVLEIRDEIIYKYERQKENTPVKKREVVRSKELEEYSGLVDYIYKNMTVSGGIFDTGYVLTKKDIKIIKKLLKEEQEKIK